MTMPPAPYPIQASALASAGTERWPPDSAAIVLSATMVIHGAPNAVARITSRTPATTQEVRLSIEWSLPGWCIGESYRVADAVARLHKCCADLCATRSYAVDKAVRKCLKGPVQTRGFHGP